MDPNDLSKKEIIIPFCELYDIDADTFAKIQ